MQEAGIADGTKLSDLRHGDDIDMSTIRRLLGVMRKHSKPVLPKRLGLIGKTAIEAAMMRFCTGGFRYKHAAITDEDGLPVVVEVAFGMGVRDAGRKLVTGLNWAPVFTSPLEDILGWRLVQPNDDVIVFMHITKPRFTFTDHGKGQVEFGKQLRTLIKRLLEQVTTDFAGRSAKPQPTTSSSTITRPVRKAKREKMRKSARRK